MPHTFLAFTAAMPLTGKELPQMSDQSEPFEVLPGARAVVYKTVGDVRLPIHIFEPPAEFARPRPAIVFFFGGGWSGGTPTQFTNQCAYLASRGMVAASAEYRVHSRHGVTPFECISDGKSAVWWLRAHAGELGIDPARIAAGGGSAGGHVAACTATIAAFGEPGEDLGVSSVPGALVLFNPVLDTTLDPGGLGKRFEGRAQEASPVHHVRAGLPPTIVFHGTADECVPVSVAEAYAEKARAAGNRCELMTFEGEPHGFFNYGRGDGHCYTETMRATDRFLASLGWLEGEPTL
jgi:acetyl esterase/lipase